MTISTIGVSAAVTPAVVKTCVSHYTNRKPRRKKPTAHISYDEGLHLVRSFLEYASHHTVEDLQTFTAQWVPHPSWVRVENVEIPSSNISAAAKSIINQLGPDGIRQVGGKQWWQWRRKNAALKAEWIEMRSDYNARIKAQDKCKRIMLYVHGGGYFFGSVDEHRYQLQRHARKLQARVFAPRYRLAPQFPFPCGLQDCLAAYLYLLTIQDPTEIILAGDSAGGGMIVSMLCVLRDQGHPLPAGAILLSPWVDLTHSFPSLGREDEFDFIPAHGFMQKPSSSWPPPIQEDLIAENSLVEGEGEFQKSCPYIQISGKHVLLKEQIQMYTTNSLLTNPLVSPVLQPSLGGLPPLLILVGGGERLRDEQIYLAHKAANPTKFPLGKQYRQKYDPEDKILNTYKPTPVQLQVWEDLCHVAPTLSFTRPAKFMYRSIAQFGAWALARAQKTSIEILDDDNISLISASSESDREELGNSTDSIEKHKNAFENQGLSPPGQIGKAGDPLPPFKGNMIRQQVDRHGTVYPLSPAADIPALQMAIDEVGVIKEGPVIKWMAAKKEWDAKYAGTIKKVAKARSNAGDGISFGADENPPPSALARRRNEADVTPKAPKKSWGLGLWSLWGWKHDEKVVQREQELAQKANNGNTSDNIDSISEPNSKHDQDSLSSPMFSTERSILPDATNNEAMTLSTTGSQPLSPSEDGMLSPHSGKSRSYSRRRASSSGGRRRTISVRDEGQTEGKEVSQEVPQVILASEDGQEQQKFEDINPMSVADSTHLSPVTGGPFLPKFKTVPYLQNDSDTVSNYSQMTTGRTTPAGLGANDNASTMAIFSAPGVVQPEEDGGSRPTTATGSATDVPSTVQMKVDKDGQTRGGAAHQHDHLGGYETPVSRHSIERLQSTQLEPEDIDHINAAVSSDFMAEYRLAQIRSPSSQAIVRAEGVIEPLDSADLSDEKGSTEQAQIHGIDVKDGDIALPRTDGTNSEREPKSDERPKMYDRTNTEFQTAVEQM